MENMSVFDDLVFYFRSLFSVLGVSKHNSGESILIEGGQLDECLRDMRHHDSIIIYIIIMTSLSTDKSTKNTYNIRYVNQLNNVSIFSGLRFAASKIG
jgi:hypothetical protein